jgi:hypothetical protein
MLPATGKLMPVVQRRFVRPLWIMKTLEERNRQRQIELPKYPRPNGIAYPKCGKEMHDRDGNILTSNPPQKAVICLECGHNDFALA